MSECWPPKLLYQNWPEEKLLQTSAQSWSRILYGDDNDDDVFFTFFYVTCFLDTYCVLPNITTTCHTNNYNYNNHITRAKMKHLLFCAKQRLRRIAACRPLAAEDQVQSKASSSVTKWRWRNFSSEYFSPHLTLSLPQFPCSFIPSITDATQS